MDDLSRDFGRVWGKPYGAGWHAVRRAALRRADGRCEIGDGRYRGLCTRAPSARLHVHHVGVGVYQGMWPLLRYEDVAMLVVHAYRLAWAKGYGELERYLRGNPELFPVLCPHHHSLMEYGENAVAMLELVGGNR